MLRLVLRETRILVFEIPFIGLLQIALRVAQSVGVHLPQERVRILEHGRSGMT